MATLRIFCTAHPDDESMFFVPTISAQNSRRSNASCCHGDDDHQKQSPPKTMKRLGAISGQPQQQQQKQQQPGRQQQQQQRQTWLLCLSNGNYDGLGKTREEELRHVGKTHLCFDRIILVDHEELQDSPTDSWSEHTIASVLEHYVPKIQQQQSSTEAGAVPPDKKQEKINQSESQDAVIGNIELYTFDEKGVSGHLNHVDTHRGVKRFLRNRHNSAFSSTSNNTLQAYQLVTITSLFQKYLPIWHWIMMIVSWITATATARTIQKRDDNKGIFVVTSYRLYQPSLNWKCMTGHASQFVWYRRLFIIFSCYTYENKWISLQAAADDDAPQEVGKEKMQ